jgi:hypothetical protein
VSVETPSEKLARKIIERLVREVLITQQTGNRMLPKLADGTLQAEDWRLPLELGNSKARKR